MGADVSVVLFDFGRYNAVLLPAVQRVLEFGETKQISELISLAAASSFASKWADLPSPILEEYLSILEGTTSYKRLGVASEPTTREDMLYFVAQICVPQLIGLFIPEVVGFAPEQNMSRSSLPLFLYSQSAWIESYFTFSRKVSGPSLEYPFGEWSGLFSSNEVTEFYLELEGLEVPHREGAMTEIFENLRSIVNSAYKQRWNLLLRVC